MTDAAGQRTFTYNSDMQRSGETLPSGFYGDKVLTNKYEADTGTKPGRDKGSKLGTSTDPDADMELTYAYTTKGRFDSVTDSNGSYDYTYVTDSEIVGTVDYPITMSATKSYESNRDVVDYVDNTVGGSTVSKYNYTNDAAGRRTDVVTTGSAFSSDTFNKYGYNSRSEVTSGQKYNGTDTSDTSHPVTSYDYDLSYDPIGNRETYADAGTQTDYTTNELNQYTDITTLTNPTYNADGCMTLMPSSSGDWDMTWNAENRGLGTYAG